ncbi:hypothetical protein Taro_052402 [Colocasia esculenta]|uniref:Uncharacterized protein n=1 Tax=Colocasia esculenta TaxID=4460 RepID=A0A843XIC4_COLES|nr:hypothetical protein [Colocasia esculenta]
MAEVMIEMMKFAREQIWDTKSKLNVSLPYAHLLTKVFKHFGVDLSGAVTEKMAQAIRSRNLKKSRFSLNNGIWSKASVAEGEAIIGDAQVDHQEEVPLTPAAEPALAASVAVEPATLAVPESAAGPLEQAAEQAAVAGSPIFAVESPLPEAPAEEAMAGAINPLPTSIIASILKEVLDSIHSTPVTPEAGGELVAEVVALGHIEESIAAPVQEEQSNAPADVVLEEAPIQGEQEPIERDAPIQGEQSKEGQAEAAHCDEPMGSVPADEDLPNAQNDATDGETTSSTESDDDQQPPASEARKEGKEVVSDVPLLADTPFERQVKHKIVINLKPVIERLDVQGTILCSLQSDVNSIFMSQASSSKEISSIRNVMKWFNNKMSSMKTMLSEILKVVGAQVTPSPPPSAAQVPESGPSGSSVPVSEPSAAAAGAAEAEINEQGFFGPAEQNKGPSRPLESKSVENLAEEAVLVPEPPAPTSSQTPVPPSPPSSSTAPPAPQTFKQPQPRPISSPTPFPSQSISSPELLPASSSARPSSYGPSTSNTFSLPTVTLHSIFNPPTPPSFITLIPEGAQLPHVEIQDIKDEFEVAILRSVLAVGTHTHRTGSSSPVSKKRRLTSTHSASSKPCYPPLWFSFSISNKQKLIYEEYPQKVVFAHIFGLPFQNLSEHLTTIFPYTHLSKAHQSKVFSMTEAKTKEQWVWSHKELYSQFCRVQAAKFPPREAPLPLSEWFQIHHKNLFGPFIQKEIKFIRHYQMYCNYCYADHLPESQLGQFRVAIRALNSSTAHTEPLQVDFATLVIPDVMFLPPLHALIMDSSVGTLIFEQAARVMARLFVQDGRDLSFPRFVFRQYLQGHIKADVLAPILSECEQLSPEEWQKLYPLFAQQLSDLNASQASSNQPLLSPGEFLDANSLHLIRDSYLTWVERYKVFFALKQELRSLKIDYPLKLEAFLRFASFGSFLTYKLALGPVKIRNDLLAVTIS